MLSPEHFIKRLEKNGAGFFTGVPDSLLKEVCAYITDHVPSRNHIIAVNEGSAVGLAAGYHLATGRIPVVYMQNSGLGNSVNPLLSLMDREVYNMPLLLLVGWRGEPGVKDEPQHVKQGKVTLPLLEAMGIRYAVLSEEEALSEKQVTLALDAVRDSREPFALVVPKGTFAPYALKKKEEKEPALGREEAIRMIAASLDEREVVVATTGMISRELFEYRESVGEGHERDFLTVGSMGHASQIALGIALQQPERKVYCFDGDGAFLMHMGGAATIGSLQPSNLIHIVLNNGAHDSVGGQPTAGFQVDIPRIASGCGYKRVVSVGDPASLRQTMHEVKKETGPVLIEVKVKKGARKELGRPTVTPVDNKHALMAFLKR